MNNRNNRRNRRLARSKQHESEDNSVKPIKFQAQKAIETKERLRKKLAVKQGPKKIILTMIVKNESNNMIRLLDSVKCIIDMISIVDTGSTDNTEEVILKWGKDNNIPTTVHHEPFKNFSHNRTHSVKMAKQTYPEADYILLSDADFIWKIRDGERFDKTLLVDHKYLIEQHNKVLSYWNIRMLSTKIEFSCIGVTHEFWSECKDQGEIRTAKITTLLIDDREDGGCKEDKFERDERLLRGGLEDPNTPNDIKTRYKFYLAQTLKDMGKYEESLEWYNKRILDQGWEEEMYYSKFQLGVNCEQLGWKKRHVINILSKPEQTDEDKIFLLKWNANNYDTETLLKQATEHFTNAGDHYLAAFTYRKQRAEALYYLVRMYRLLGMVEQALDLAILGNKIKYPEQDTLFIERDCYTYLFDFEIALVAAYIPAKKDLGRQALGRLLPRDDMQGWIKDMVNTVTRNYL